MKYAWINACRDRYSVSRLCRIRDASRSGYCQWRRRGPSVRAQANAALDAAVAAIHRSSRGCYSRPRIVRQLRAQGQPASAERVRRSLQRQGLRPVCSVRIESRRIRRVACWWRRICLTVVSTAGSPIRHASATSRSSGPAKAGYIWRRSWIWLASASWAGRCPSESTLTWSARHCAARAGNANRHRGCCYIPTGLIRPLCEQGLTETEPPTSS